MDSSDKSKKLEEDARTYCNILASCSLPEVANWKDEDLERVFRWSSYFTRVHNRCANRASWMDKFDKIYCEVGRQRGVRFGGEPFSYSFVGSSHDYLIKALIENPALPEELRQNVLQAHVKSEEKDTLLKHLEELESSRELMRHLQAIHIKVTQHREACHSNTTPLGPLGGLASVDAEYLLEDIHCLLSQRQATPTSASLASSNETLVCKKLSTLVLDMRGGMEVVLQSLTKAPHGGDGRRDNSSVEKFDKERSVILRWLLDQLRCTVATTASPGKTPATKLNQFQKMLFHHTSPGLLSSVASNHLTFFKEYLQLLMTKAEEIDQKSMVDLIRASLQDSMDTDAKESCDEDKDLDLLLDHFTKLAHSSEQTREICVSLLKSKLQQPAGEVCLPPLVGTILNRILHAVSTNRIKIVE